MKILSDKSGFTLVEMLIVLGIIIILLAIAAFAFSEWVTKYNIESQVKQMYSDLQNARARAMQTNRMHFITLAGGSFSVTDDTNPPPFGNQINDDPVIMTQKYGNAISTSFGFPPTLSFDSRGISNIAGVPGTLQAICVISNVSADYDCITVGQTGLNMGKLNPGGACAAANCFTK